MSESPLSIFQREKERTGSVEEARRRDWSDCEKERRSDREMQRTKEVNERGERLREQMEEELSG